MNERLIIQAQTGCVTPVVPTFTHPISKERQEGISVTFASNRFNCFDSDQSIYKNDTEALAKIKAFFQKRNDQVPGTYLFLTPEEYAMFGDKDTLTAIWLKVKRKALTNPETLSDVLSNVEIDILKRQASGQSPNMQSPDIMAPVFDERRPQAGRGTASTKSQEMIPGPGTPVDAMLTEDAAELENDTPIVVPEGEKPVTLPPSGKGANGKSKGKG